ncbi:uncharacterized protein TRAVEDRAFT_24625 [Trametes versicolor FP-101664 SS1]|uniref:uncharacterized protein n=1 Tax=Trametes versicolor (strain FP-101664) TaxID=717944 RepID=UPI0004622A3D|nr:uncharacterized protein TRAVEDRAFT_24625 [Trametes versicolor FP-101664 SS1]EIW52426.1 hypothetical protein TRAVEDRAFT_24625 [Trametes versicolor FP-101664 SS1]
MTTPTSGCHSGTTVSFCPSPESSTPSLTGSIISGSLIFGLAFFISIGALFWYRYRHPDRLPLRFFDPEAARWVIHSRSRAGSHSWRKRIRDSFLWSQLFGSWHPPSHTGGPRQTARRAHNGADAPAIGVRRPPRALTPAPPPPYDPYHFDPVHNVFILHEFSLAELTPARSPEAGPFVV